MRWERRKPLWPVMAALGLLFVLAIAASRTWQSPEQQAKKQAANQESISPANSVPESVSEPTPIEPSPQLDLPTEIIAPAFELTPPLVEQVDPLPTQREFDLTTLTRVRDLLRSIVDQLPPVEQCKATEMKPLASQRTTQSVRVSSENDRLAMILPRPVQQLKPVAPGETTKEEATNFAAILLEAAQGRKPKNVAKQSVPRLAMRSAQSDSKAEYKTAPTPELAVPQQMESPRPELAPIEPAPLQHRPVALVKQLEGFSASSPGAVWSQQVLAQIRLLTDESSVERPAVSEILARLEALQMAGTHGASNSAGQAFRSEWQQASQSLERRLVIWRLLLDPEQPKIVSESLSSTELLPLLSNVATLLEEEQNGNDWREYLLLERIAAATSENISSPALARAKLAQEILSRMKDVRLSDAQREFLATDLFVHLQQELRTWAAGRVNLETLTALIERYESGREMRYAAVIAQLQQRLKWSSDPNLQTLAAHLEQYYRGANLRIAMSGNLLNRMMPKQEPIITPVRDRIAGAKVRGSARTTTQLRVRMMPDPNAWHFGLEATGKVYSNTKSDTWPARVRNAAKLQYQARKEISIDEQGLHVAPTKAKAQGRNDLVGVDSQLDPVPILGRLLRDLAKQKHAKSRPTAINQAKAKVVRQAKKRMDEATDSKLLVIEQQFRARVLAPIEELALLAEPLDMHTTEQRAVMQLRLANMSQLAAHTPRPLAPSDSVLSMQMHETALNNAMMGLGLDGRRMTLLELFDFLAERFGQTEATPPEDMPRKAIIEFTARDAARVQCDGDRLELIFSVKELAHRRDKIKNFQIHVHFRPRLSGLEVQLVRDGTLQFSGRRLKTGPRVVLHSIIGKVIRKDQQISLLNAKLLSDPRLDGLMVTQLVIEDGWIGLAIGPAHPRRTAWRAPMPEVLSTPFVR